MTIITETWLTGEINDNQVIPSSHKIFRRDRSSRGVAIVLISSIDAVLLDQIDDHESLFLTSECVRFQCHFVCCV